MMHLEKEISNDPDTIFRQIDAVVHDVRHRIVGYIS